MKEYHVQRIPNEAGGDFVICTVVEKSQQPSQEHSLKYSLQNSKVGRQHSPTGFEMGYGGSGPAALAHSILADFFGDEAKASEVYQDFKLDCIATATEDFIITSEDIQDWFG